MKSYKLRKDGKSRKNSNIKTLIPQESIDLIMEKMGIKQRKAEELLTSRSIELFGNWDSGLYLEYIECDEALAGLKRGGNWVLAIDENCPEDGGRLQIDPVKFLGFDY